MLSDVISLLLTNMHLPKLRDELLFHVMVLITVLRAGLLEAFVRLRMLLTYLSLLQSVKVGVAGEANHLNFINFTERATYVILLRARTVNTDASFLFIVRHGAFDR